MVALLVAAPAAAASGQGVNWNAEKAPELYKHEDVLTVAAHDRADMTSPLEYYDDSGEVTSLPAHLNETQDTPVGVRLDKIEADRYQLFPRVSGETENKQTWLNAANWTTSTNDATNVSPSLADADGATASGVPAVAFSASGMGAGDTATASFGQGVTITSDADKRVLMFAGSVPTLPAGSSVEIRAMDSDGDYRYASINSSADASQGHVIVNTTTTGIFYQSRLSNLPIAGTGDGAMGEIASVDLVMAEGDAKVNVVGLDLEGKTIVSLGETMEDTDGDGDDEPNTVENYTAGGELDLTSLSTLGSTYDSAVIHDLKVYNVRYGVSDLDPSDYRSEFGDAEDYGAYDRDLQIEAPLKVPTAIDLSHGTLTLRGDQQFVNERYAFLGVHEDAAKDSNASSVNDSDYTDKKSAYSQKDDTHTLLSTGVTAGSTDWIQVTILLLNSEYEALSKPEDAVMGPPGDSGGMFSNVPILGGVLNFVFTPLGAAVSTILGAIGLGKKMSG